MKTCYKCKDTKPNSHFSKNRKRKDGLNGSCKLCCAQYTTKKRRNKDKKLVAENREKMWEYLSSHPCVDCGEKDPVVLEFDHVRNKTANVTFLVREGYEWDMIMEEIEKCEMRCVNCHRRKTAREQNWFKHTRSLGV